LLAHGRWLSPGTPASSTTKTGRHDIAEILLKVALITKNQSHPSNYDMTNSLYVTEDIYISFRSTYWLSRIYQGEYTDMHVLLDPTYALVKLHNSCC
jgi:hypothetical protein